MPAQPDLVPLRHASGKPIVAPRMLRALVAIAEAIFCTHDGAPPRARLDWLERELEDFLARAGKQTRLVLGLATLAVSVAAPLLSLRFAPLRRLPVKERVRALARMEDSPFGAPVLAVKALLCVLYYENPDVQLEVGFDGQCLGERS